MLNLEPENRQKRRTIHLRKYASSNSKFSVGSHTSGMYERAASSSYTQTKTRKILGTKPHEKENGSYTVFLTALPPPGNSEKSLPISKLQFEKKNGGRKIRFTAAEISAEKTYYLQGEKTGSYAEPSISQDGRRFKDAAKRFKGRDLFVSAKEALENKASVQLSKEADKSENDAVRAADRERVIGTKFGRVGMKGGKAYRSNEEGRVDKADAKKVAKERLTLEKEKLYELRHGKEAPSAIKRKKQKLKRKQIRKFADQTIGVKRTDFLVRVIKELQKATRKLISMAVSWLGVPVLIFSALCLLLFAFCSMMFAAITNTAVVTMSSYTSDETAIEAASMLATKLEASLEKEISGIPSAWEWGHIDEFRYFTEDIGHNPFELMAYLSVKYPGFDMGITSPVHLAISDLHKKRYKLELDEAVETRTETEIATDPTTGEEYEIEYEYDYYILNVYLTSRSIESVARAELQESENGELWEWYQVLMDTGGARQEFANPFPGIDWRNNVTSRYGYRVNPISNANLQIHRGLDIAMPRGTEIHAGLNGFVTWVGYDSTYGNYVIIDNNVSVLKYAHCNDVLVSRGQKITKGQVIATVGNTGASTGNHVHIEAKRADTTFLNPIFLINYMEDGGNDTN